MRKGKFPTFSNSILVVAILLCSAAGLWATDYSATGHMENDKGNDPAGVERADLIMIDVLSKFEPLERPAVAFLHDKHTRAMEKRNKDCLTCHKEKEGKLSPKFIRPDDTEDKDRNQIMGIYHDNCIACHVESAGEGLESGPVTCGECHRKAADLIPAQEPMGMDKSLHYRHVQAQEKKCELCHHEYDAATQKLFYEKGREGTCRYCHKAETEENRISGRLAAHIQCLSCHREKIAQELNAGPIHCNGCHSKAAQKKIEKVAEIPRMERNQPDVVLIRSAAEAKPQAIPAERVAPVPFNHKAHEGYNDTCRACHHASMEACTNCHTPVGTEDGQNVRLARAMHQRDAIPSCIGCHAEKQTATQCAGCHKAIKTKQPPDNATCAACHPEGTDVKRMPISKEEAEMMAAELLEAQTAVTATYALEDIPEKVAIQTLSDQYQPVELPHRKIISKLVANLKDNKIAGHFHTDPGTLCQGCHHNSPTSKTPPKCSSCHGEPFDAGKPMRPGLMGAYHQQCFVCHAAMGIEKPDSRDCTACHPKKEAS